MEQIAFGPGASAGAKLIDCSENGRVKRFERRATPCHRAFGLRPQRDGAIVGPEIVRKEIKINAL
ncbi:MAG: hypothetical protein ETSY1_22855 [Candidatus Entotheonella factor]|uniref:Uncharacterized protein n=1 Tax=Entotheonella factor TaxID=1429438 RepID=W4LJ91_ENTF1|nr:MAG: hypothetical protein ETSY1_22855 [Candidatus Entotheonella factor]